ncbi:FHA domain-containing protein [Microbacterium sp. P02]|uniref:FHA domain-containing protein n=1 Tax=Microbacterium sp. P02 TaxID=3366260 RepID=UPI00367208E1
MFTYTAGGEDAGFALIADHVVVLIDRSAGVDFVTALYRQLQDEDGGLDAALDAIAGADVGAAVAVVELRQARERTLRAAVRGAFSVEMGGGGSTRLGGPSRPDWSMTEASGVHRFTLRAPDAPDLDALPLRSGVVRATRVDFAIDDGVPPRPGLLPEDETTRQMPILRRESARRPDPQPTQERVSRLLPAEPIPAEPVTDVPVTDVPVTGESAPAATDRAAPTPEQPPAGRPTAPFPAPLPIRASAHAAADILGAARGRDDDVGTGGHGAADTGTGGRGTGGHGTSDRGADDHGTGDRGGDHALVSDTLAPAASGPAGWIFGLPDGSELDDRAPIVFGRKPWHRRGRLDDAVHVVVPSPRREISGEHLEIRISGSSATARDLGSTNGTLLFSGDGAPRLVHAGVEVPLSRGDILDLGEGFCVTVGARRPAFARADAAGAPS